MSAFNLAYWEAVGDVTNGRPYVMRGTRIAFTSVSITVKPGGPEGETQLRSMFEAARAAFVMCVSCEFGASEQSSQTPRY
jgi:hypothetical protein